jgi:ATP-dependent exoDNAse (exonuclease V) beta subunit
MEGKIDLLFREGKRWVLVDYKTDAVIDATAHATQLRAYRDALNKTAGIQVEELLVFFLRTGEVVDLA